MKYQKNDKKKSKHKWRKTGGRLTNSTKQALQNATSLDNIVCMLEIKGEMNVKRRHMYKDTINLLSGGKDGGVKSEKQIRTEKVKEHMDDYIDSSSLHGLSYIFDKRHSIRRVIWFVITVAAFGFAMQKVYESTMNYFDFPFNTARMRKYVDELEFPAVSFCNLNDMRISVLNGTLVDAAILDNSKMGLVSGEEYRQTTMGAAHKLEEMIVSCKFNGEPCSAKNFTQFFWMQGDRCFTFNSGKINNKILSVRGTGVEKGLTLTINIQHYEYYRDGKTAGIHLILHGQDETPVRIRGPMIPPGFTTYIQILKKKILNLEAPYKTKCGSIPLKYFKKYSKHTCWLEQLTDFVNGLCFCKDFFMPGDAPICSLDQAFQCMWPNWEIFDKEKKYNCPLSCEIDTFYSHTASRALFPSHAHSIALAREFEQIDHVKKLNPNISDEKTFMRDNLVRLKLYYDDLSYELLEQQPSYGTLVWLGDVGGQIGLFIGAGAMSYFEFIDCIALMIYARFFQSFKQKPIEV